MRPIYWWKRWFLQTLIFSWYKTGRLIHKHPSLLFFIGHPSRCKYLKCHDSALYSVACIDPNTAVTGDEDGFVKMWVVFIYGSKTTTCAWLKPQLAYLIPKILNLRWDLRSSESNSIMTFKRFDEFVSSFCKVSKCTKVQCLGVEIDMCNWTNELCVPNEVGSELKCVMNWMWNV